MTSQTVIIFLPFAFAFAAGALLACTFHVRWFILCVLAYAGSAFAIFPDFAALPFLKTSGGHPALVFWIGALVAMVAGHVAAVYLIRIAGFLMVWAFWTFTTCGIVLFLLFAFRIWSGDDATRSADTALTYAVLLPGNTLALWGMYLFAGLVLAGFQYVISPR